MHIDTLLNSVNQQAKDQDNAITLSVDSNWLQGRTLYGGISSALVYQAIREAIPQGKVIRSMNTNFIGPVVSDNDFEITVEILREGKNATQVLGRLVQDGKVAVMIQACFGTARASTIDVPNEFLHNMDYPQNPSIESPKGHPKFLDNFDLVAVKGGLPFSGDKGSSVHGWMRLKNHTTDVTDAHLIALIDTWPPTVLQMLHGPAMASTMSWSLEFIHPHQSISGSDWFAYQAQTRQSSDGYAHTEANIWDKNGTLVAISRQLVAVFA